MSLLVTQCWSTASDHSAPHAQVPCLRRGSPALKTLAPSPVRSGLGWKATMVPHQPGDRSTYGRSQGKTFSEPQADPWHLTPAPLFPSTPVLSTPIPQHPCSLAPDPCTLIPVPLPPGTLPPGSRTSCQTGLPAWLMPMGADAYGG